MSPLIRRENDLAIARRWNGARVAEAHNVGGSVFVLRQIEILLRPLTGVQARQLLATLTPPYDLMARWQRYTGLGVSELLGLTVDGAFKYVGLSSSGSMQASDWCRE